MAYFTKLLPTSFIILLLVGCASSGSPYKGTKNAELPPNIKYQPAIDVAYSAVANNIKENIGTNVRWGGHVISSETLDDTITRLTVYSYPLTQDGRPITETPLGEGHGRFIVDLPHEQVDATPLDEHFISLFGTVSAEFTIENGGSEKSIPVVAALELVDWNKLDKKELKKDRRYHPHFGLSYRAGYYFHPYHYRFAKLRFHNRYGYYGFRKYGFRSYHGYRPYRGYYSRGIKRSRRH